MRVLPADFLAAIASGNVTNAVLADLTFVSGTEHVWTGIGPIGYGSNTYRGVGSLAGLGSITESTAVAAVGTSVSLSGIDPAILGECLADIQLGAPAVIWFAAIVGGVPVPYKAFQGVVDQPEVDIATDTVSITLKLETRMVYIQKPSARRYTTEDQHLDYPDDCGFSRVPCMNDIALKLGS